MPSAVLDIRYLRAVNTTDKNCAPEELTVPWINLCKMCIVSGRVVLWRKVNQRRRSVGWGVSVAGTCRSGNASLRVDAE